MSRANAVNDNNNNTIIQWSNPVSRQLSAQAVIYGPFKESIPQTFLSSQTNQAYSIVSERNLEKLKTEFCGDVGWAHMENLFYYLGLNHQNKTALILGFISVADPVLVDSNDTNDPSTTTTTTRTHINLLCVHPRYRQSSVGCTLVWALENYLVNMLFRDNREITEHRLVVESVFHFELVYPPSISLETEGYVDNKEQNSPFNSECSREIHGGNTNTMVQAGGTGDRDNNIDDANFATNIEYEWSIQNNPSLRFWLNLGFEPIGVVLTTIWLEKTIVPQTYTGEFYCSARPRQVNANTIIELAELIDSTVNVNRSVEIDEHGGRVEVQLPSRARIFYADKTLPIQYIKLPPEGVRTRLQRH
jgi:hypothetical protein